jgi:hypothetical protein
MNGYDTYDYGARGYYAAMGRFTSVDRFAEKYPWQSPYCFAANNPVNNIDINGDSIWVSVYNQDTKTNDRYYYGSDKNGDQGFLDSSGNIYSGDNQYVSDLTNALSELGSESFGESLVDDLANSTKNVTIANSRNGENKADENGTYILWSPKNTEGGMSENGTTSRSSFVGLGHEMGHIQDKWKGTLDNSTWIDIEGKKISRSEIYATHVENQIRAEHGMPLRTHYALLGGISGINIGYEPTRLIINSNSIYYRKFNAQGYIVPFNYR